ncbi:hypothetical protein KC957_04415, partial [Candidatus Saccharibacteria bacterium]|nr:hypothetical protein [Candidatus Saccharibacteria bacterium]
MTTMQRLRRLAIILLIPVVITAGLLVFGPGIREWYILRDYTPPTEISQLATQTTMTDQARRLFYLNRPQVQDRSEFNASCEGAGGEHTIVLGCYHSPQRGIFVFSVTDTQLKGVEQVTAAHEMLHAAYDRLSRSDRQRIDGLLVDYYQHDLKDERIKRVMDLYKRSAPDDLPNEMHSIFGTEVGDLPEELEDYYRTYFTSRQTVVGFSRQYQAAFTKRQDQIEAYDARLTQLEAQIKVNQTSLNQQAASLQADRARVASSGDQE